MRNIERAKTKNLKILQLIKSDSKYTFKTTVLAYTRHLGA